MQDWSRPCRGSPTDVRSGSASPHRTTGRCIAIVLVLLVSPFHPSLPLQAQPPTTDFYRDVLPIFRGKCFRCHSSLDQEGGLRLDSLQAVRDGGDSGGVDAQRPRETSELWQRVTTDDDSRMPPAGEQLTKSQLAILQAWLEQGLPADEAQNQHWALKPPRKTAWPKQLALAGPTPSPDVVHSPRPETRYDVWLEAGYVDQTLQPVDPIAPPLWLRRLYLDLIGVPPTTAELDDFLADPRPDARERVVDRLLASPLYGERWGRHWMDVWRYSDWSGYGNEVRNSQEHIWRWRDWIVDSLNDDKGYDQMIVEMLAADEVAPTDPDQLRATGFLVRNWYRFNRNTWLQNTVDHTSKGFLGITMGCAVP